jgi:hypothetical protein
VNSILVNCVYTIGCCIAEIVLRTLHYRDDHGESAATALGEALADNPASLIVLVFVSIVLFLIGGLAGFHGYLLWRNVTTNEELKGLYRGNQNPYRRGRLLYCLQSFCSPAYNSYIRPRVVVVDV